MRSSAALASGRIAGPGNWFEMGHVLGSCPYDNASLELKWRDIVGLYMKADN